jgi:hypothetical protein
MICLASRALLLVGDCRHILGLLVQGWPTAKVARDVHRKRGNPGCPEGVRAGSSVSEVREAFVTTPAKLNHTVVEESRQAWEFRSSTQQSQVHHGGDGPGLRIEPQLAPGPEGPIQSADRSTATVGGVDQSFS